MSDLFATVDPQRLVLAAMIIIAACTLLFSLLMALCFLALAGARRQATNEFQDPDPFLAPGPDNGLKIGTPRVGPPPARARSGTRTTGPGTPQ